MASVYTMAVLGILWLLNMICILLMAIVGGTVFKHLQILAGQFPANTVSYSSVQYVFPAFFFFLLITLVIISYKIYQEIFADTVYVQGY